MRIIVLLIGLTVFLPTLAEPLRVFGYELDYRLQPDGQAHYNVLITEMQRRGVPLELVILPMPRAVRMFSEVQEGCVFPASINAIETTYPDFSPETLVEGDSIDRVSLRVFTRSGEPKITDLAQLEGKRVALWGGLDPELFLSGSNALVEQTPSEGVRLRMLNARRLDVIIGFLPDVLLVAEAENLPLPEYYESIALFEDEGASIVCHDTAASRTVISAFNRELEVLKNSGQLRLILGPHADIVN